MKIMHLVISLSAQNDLKEIYKYGRRNWSSAKSESYLNEIKNQMWMLTQQPLMGIDRSELLKESRSLMINRHTLFYRVTADNVEIIRVLHNRQDPSRPRLRNRDRRIQDSDFQSGTGSTGRPASECKSATSPRTSYRHHSLFSLPATASCETFKLV